MDLTSGGMLKEVMHVPPIGSQTWMFQMYCWIQGGEKMVAGFQNLVCFSLSMW